MERNQPQGICWTSHALKRHTSRRVPLTAISLLLAWGRQWYHEGRIVVRLDRRSVARARRSGINLRALEGIHAVFEPDDTVVTVWRHRSGRRIKR